MGRGVPDIRPLVGVAAVVSLLTVLGVVPAWPGLAHHVALPPLDLFADLRVLLAEAPSYPWFVAWLVVAVVVRAVVLAAMLGALDRAGVVASLAFYGVALVPAALAGGLGFAGVAAVYSVFLWLGVAVALVTVLVLAPMPWREEQRVRGGRLLVVGYLGALGVASLVSTLGGPGVRVGILWASAGLTAATVRWLAADREPRRARAAPHVALAVLVVAVPLAAPAAPPSPGQARQGTLFLVPGIGGASGTSTMFELDPAALGFACERTAYFSYAGTGEGAPQRSAHCPITRGARYRAEDTLRPMDELAASFRAQLAGLDPPVVVVAHSQGGWVVAAGLDGRAASGVDTVVLLGAHPRHDRGYVLDGTGPGVAGTDVLEALMAGLRAADATTFDPRAPLPRGHLGVPGAIEGLIATGFPAGVRVATVTSAFDLPVVGREWRLDGATDLCPVYEYHGRLPVATAVHRQVRGFLADRDPGSCDWWRRWPTQAFTAFGPPAPRDRSGRRRRRVR